MAKVLKNGFNRGRISDLALARLDFSRTAMSSEIQTNWMPRALGSMMLRPGLGYTGGSKSNAYAVTIPFIFSTDDTARIELTNGLMRVWVDDELVTRATVTAAITNGTFDSDIASWSDQDGASSTSAWVAGGYMSLIGSVNTAAKRRQQVTVNEAGTRHALNIVIERGPVYIRVGSAAGGDQYISETQLATGVHSLAFTPTGDFHIDLFAYAEAAALVDSISVASAGVMELTSPWLLADLPKIRWDQSGDVVFATCAGYRQRRIERRATDSWSIVLYQSDTGPFRLANVGPITITPSATVGDVTLTASAPLFRSTQVGTLFKLVQTGQLATEDLSGADQFTDPIRVSGIGTSRAFAVILSGTWSATVTLQYSVSAPGDWIDAEQGVYALNTGLSYNDTLDNQIIYYRLGVKSGDYTSGTVVATLSYPSGSQTGIARVTGYTSSTVVNAAVLSSFGGVTGTSDWSESYWSDYRGYPSSIGLYEGRLWQAGKDRIWGSQSDNFTGFDDSVVGDSGPISRSIGSGPVDSINWLLPMQRLLLGADGAVWSARSSSLDEPMTPANFNLKSVSTQGARAVNAAKVDSSGVFVQQAGVRVYDASFDGSNYDYAVTDLTGHVPEIGEPGIVRIAVQRQPETRIHCVRSDGTVAVMVIDKAEDIKCWVDVETDGDVEDVVVLPGTVEDQVYYTVKRTVNGATVRYFEKWALESECQGGAQNKQADSFLAGTGFIRDMDHLEGETVVVWADGIYKGDYTVSGGFVSLATTPGSWVVGLAYEARFKSTKLAVASDQGTNLCEPKKIARLGIVAKNIHAQGLRFGPDFDVMDDLPGVEEGLEVSGVRETYDEKSFAFPGNWDTDSRLCLLASAPKPVTLLACVITLEGP